MKIFLRGIQNIIFDLGKVLLNLDFNASIKAFHDLGLNQDVLTPEQAYANPVFYHFEVGRIATSEFYSGVQQALKNPTLSNRLIQEAWCAMILDIPKARVNMLQQLRKNFKLYLFSNTNQVHIDYLYKNFKTDYGFDFSSLFEKVFYSYEINERKPDVSSFKKVIELSGVNPNKTLFVDDLEKNIAGAEKAGLKTFWLQGGLEISRLF